MPKCRFCNANVKKPCRSMIYIEDCLNYLNRSLVILVITIILTSCSSTKTMLETHPITESKSKGIFLYKEVFNLDYETSYKYYISTDRYDLPLELEKHLNDQFTNQNVKIQILNSSAVTTSFVIFTRTDKTKITQKDLKYICDLIELYWQGKVKKLSE